MSFPELATWIVGGYFAYIVIGAILYDCNRKIQEKEIRQQREMAPCRHGIKGAAYNRNLCPSCIAEHEKQQAEINRKKLEEERRKAQERAKIRADVNQTRMNACFLRNMEPVEFERLVLRIYELHGFSVKHTPASGDGGIDGFIRKGDALVLLQCKRYTENNVGRPAMQMLYGNICDFQNRHPALKVSGLLATTSSITNEANDWIKGKPIEVLDINGILDMLGNAIKRDAGLLEAFLSESPNPNIYYQPVDLDKNKAKESKTSCPKCGSFLEIRNGRYGLYYGCSAYPKCRYTRSFDVGMRRNKRWHRR